MPKTAAGKWSVALIVAMPLLFYLGTAFIHSMYAGVPAGGTLWGTLRQDRPWH